MQRWILDAAKNGYLKQVEACSHLGVDVNVRDLNGRNALMYATLGGHTKVAELLITIGADVNAVSCLSGETALWHAFNNNQGNIMKLLLKNGAYVDVETSKSMAIKFVEDASY